MKNFIALILIFAFWFCNSQIMDMPGEFIRQKVVNRNDLSKDIDGSPFFFKDFINGTVFMADGKSYKGNIRYDAYNDEFQLKINEEIVGLLKTENSRVLLNNENYFLYNYLENGEETTGYFIELTKPSGGIKLLLHKRKKFVEAVKAQNTYAQDKPAAFKEEINYYIVVKEKLDLINLSKKSILKFLGDKKNSIDNYISEHKFKLKSEREFIDLINYYNSIN